MAMISSEVTIDRSDSDSTSFINLYFTISNLYDLFICRTQGVIRTHMKRFRRAWPYPLDYLGIYDSVVESMIRLYHGMLKITRIV